MACLRTTNPQRLFCLQARTETLEAALLQSAAELRHVQAMQTALRLRNQLLEKMVQLNKQAEPKSLPDYPPSKMVHCRQALDLCHRSSRGCWVLHL